MKAILPLYILLTVAVQSFSQQNASPTLDISRLSWLEGYWIRTNTPQSNRSAHEQWKKSNPYEFEGYGITLQGQDTVFLEMLKIIVKDEAVYYIVDTRENQEPVYFRFTEITESGFVCENPGHDFPKKIIYQLDGTQLKAQVSGNQVTIDFWFEKKY